jgi:hypothetical protein
MLPSMYPIHPAGIQPRQPRCHLDQPVSVRMGDVWYYPALETPLVVLSWKCASFSALYVYKLPYSVAVQSFRIITIYITSGGIVIGACFSPTTFQYIIHRDKLRGCYITAARKIVGSRSPVRGYYRGVSPSQYYTCVPANLPTGIGNRGKLPTTADTR